jgi:hypothetical protein
VCGRDARIDPCYPIGDATCPNCGSLLLLQRESGERRGRVHAVSIHKLMTALIMLVSFVVVLLIGCQQGWLHLTIAEVLIISVIGALLFCRRAL